MFIALPLACTAPAPTPSRPVVAAPPNILLVVMDTTRADHMGFLGDPRGLTPHLDALAADSVRFSGAHSHAPWTKPSTASLMTSKLPSDHGVTGWWDTLPADLPTLATVLHDAGWQTSAVIGNKALDPEINTFHLGFDAYDISAYASIGHPDDLVTSAVLADLALDALDTLEAAEAPWFLWVQFYDSHFTYFSHDTPLSLGDTFVANYAEEIAYTDRELGRLLDRVSTRDDTIVVFLADHGEELLDRGKFGHGHTLYEELVSVPLLVRVPGEAPRDEAGAVGTMDVAPTLLALADLALPDSFDGTPLLPVPSVRPVLFQESMHGKLRGAIEDGWKLVVDLEGPHLFHLDVDPGELYDLAGQGRPEEQSLMAIIVAQWPEVTTWTL